MPRVVRPMLASLASAPFHIAGWSYEEKYDGYRIIAFKDGRSVRLVTRNLIDRTASFPEIADAIAKLPAKQLVLDGEVVIFDADGVSRFQLLQRHGQSEARAVYVAFDCLYARGEDLRGEPLTERRAALAREMPARSTLVKRSRSLGTNGLKAFDRAKREGLEGLIAKCEVSTYREGARTDQWRKVKVRREDEFVIGGFTAPGGSRQGFGALLVGAFDAKGALHYAGKVGTGYSDQTLATLMATMKPLVRRESPFAERVKERFVTWLSPKLVGQFAYTEITDDGMLRHPVFLGLREDKKAKSVRMP